MSNSSALKLFGVYIAGYSLGRFFVERMRIDYAHSITGLRVNEWISVLAFVVAMGFVATGRRLRRSEPDSPKMFEPLVDVNE